MFLKEWFRRPGQGPDQSDAEHEPDAANGLRLDVIKCFSLPKKGNGEADYEDASAWSCCRIAVADGATESSFAKMWAESLVRRFVMDPPPEGCDLASWLPPLQESWEMEIGKKTLSWFAAEKAQLGAFSTLLGLTLHPDSKWSSLAVGDSCLFHIQRNSLSLAFPLVHSADFGTTPLLLSSKASKNRDLPEFVKETWGRCEIDDVFLAATDALACWFLRETEEGGTPWTALLALEDEAAFARLVNEARTAGRMRNDDVTLLAVRILGGDAKAAADP